MGSKKEKQTTNKNVSENKIVHSETESNNISLKKKAFLEAYSEAFGNVSKACEAIGINRTTFYRWKESDPEFMIELESVEPAETFIDFAEDALVTRIRSGDTTAIIFALKTKGKKRGYVERNEQTIIEKPASFDDMSEEEIVAELEKLKKQNE